MADIDFNLMPVFEALYEERRVGRAALRLGRTQSAVSQALGRLRQTFDDPLFLNSANGLVPTARARDLAPVLGELLAAWRNACRPSTFDYSTSTREFRIVAGSYIGEVVLPRVIAALDRMSGTLKLRVWNMSRHLGAWLEAGMVDMAIGTFEHLPKRIVAQPLFEHDYVWIARQGHPTASALRSVEDVLSLPRVEMDAGEGPVSSTGVWSEGGITRRAAADAHALLPTPAGPSDPSAVRLHLHQARVALEIVGRTDLVAFVPERLAIAAAPQFGVEILHQFPPVPTLDVSLIWDETQTNDPGNKWMRQLIVDAVGERER